MTWVFDLRFSVMMAARSKSIEQDKAGGGAQPVGRSRRLPTAENEDLIPPLITPSSNVGLRICAASVSALAPGLAGVTSQLDGEGAKTKVASRSVETALLKRNSTRMSSKS
jgi:hypothetical protein